MPASHRSACWTHSSRSASPATAACSPSTATRTASIRSGSKIRRPWWPSSIAPDAGATPRFWRSMRSPRNWTHSRFPSSRLWSATDARCSTTPASASPSIRAGAAVRRNSTSLACSNGSGVSWAASTVPGRMRGSRIARRSTSSDSDMNRAVGCSQADSSRPSCSAPGPRSAIRRSMPCTPRSRAQATSPRSGCMATVIRATCCGRTMARISSTSTTVPAALPCRICGCCCRAMANLSPVNSAPC